MIHMLNEDIWLVEIDGKEVLLLASDEQEARRLAQMIDAHASVKRSAIPLLMVEEVLAGGLEYIEKRREEREKSTWR